MSLQAQEPPPTTAVAERTHDILAQKLPNILQHESNKTASSALHELRFKGELGHWQSFEREVLDFYNKTKIPNPVLSYRPHPFSEVHLVNERIFCGDELSVSGRFTQNALHPVATIACLMNLGMRVGDFKVCREAHRAREKTQAFKNPDEPVAEPSKRKGAKIPDYVAVNKEDHTLRFLGEAKTPWNHDLADFIEYYKKGVRVTPLEKAFGQVADYMYAFDLKYAFLTTYTQTVFLKQEEVKGKWKLYFSDPIYNDTGKSTTPAQGDSVPGLTVRHCLLWLCCITRGGSGKHVAENGTPLDQWLNTDSVTQSAISSPWRGVLRTGDVSLSPFVKSGSNQRLPGVGRPQAGLMERMIDSRNPYNPDDTPSRRPGPVDLALRPDPSSLGSRSQYQTPSHSTGQGYSTSTPRSRSQSSQESQGSEGSRSRHETPSRPGRTLPPQQIPRETRALQRSRDRESPPPPPTSSRGQRPGRSEETRGSLFRR